MTDSAYRNAWKQITATAFILCCAACAPGETPTASPRQRSYILKNHIRPTHWSQEQWDTLDLYLKRIDRLETRIEELETGKHKTEPQGDPT